MARLSDSMVVGQPILPQSHFGTGFYDAFDTLDLETSNVPGNRTGKWKKGFYADNWAKYGLVWGSDEENHAGANFVHGIINSETQVYVGSRKPPPSGLNPYTRENGNLIISSAKPLPADIDWARLKAADKNADGSDGAFHFDKPAKYTSGMLSSYGRFAMSKGRWMARGRTPYGADGSFAHFAECSAIFPALWWLLMDQPYGCDQNGEPFGDGQTTYLPGQYSFNGGPGTEVDMDENFGESRTTVHQTFHRKLAFGQNNTATANHFARTLDLLSVFREPGVDILEDKLGFHMDGVYTYVFDLPPEMRDPLPLYELDAGQPWLHPTSVVQGAHQQHADGSSRFMRFAHLTNLARDGKWPIDQARAFFNDGLAMPPHTDDCRMEMEWCGAFPLLDDNPDDYCMSIKGVATATDGVPYIPPGTATLHAPSNVDVVLAGGEATVSWTQPEDTTGITGYDVRRGSTKLTLTDSAAVSFIDTPPAGTHTYSVRSYRTLGATTTYSADVSSLLVVPPDPEAPPTDVDLSAPHSFHSIPVRSTFAVNHAPEGTDEATVTARAEIPADSAPDDFNYKWTVGHGLDIIGADDGFDVELAFSESIGAGARAQRDISLDIQRKVDDTPDPVVLLPPFGFEAVLTAGDVALAWQRPTDMSGITGFAITRNDEPLFVASPTSTGFTDIAPPAQRLTYRIRSIGAQDVTSSPARSAVVVKAPPSGIDVTVSVILVAGLHVTLPVDGWWVVRNEATGAEYRTDEHNTASGRTLVYVPGVYSFENITGGGTKVEHVSVQAA